MEINGTGNKEMIVRKFKCCHCGRTYKLFGKAFFKHMKKHHPDELKTEIEVVEV